jgi:hypothetical protein
MAQPELRDALFIPSDYQANFKQVIAKRSDLVKFASGRVPASVQYYAGQVLGYASTGANAGKYVAYSASNTDGSQVAVGVLSEDCLSDAAGNGSEVLVIKAGCLFNDLLIGLDAAAVTALKGSQYPEHGINLIDIYA